MVNNELVVILNGITVDVSKAFIPHTNKDVSK